MRPSEEQLNSLRAQWGLDAGEIKFIRYVENFVYEARLENRPVILRVTEPRHRSKEQIHAELDWMDDLTQRGMQLASPVRSANGHLVEELAGDSDCFVSYFVSVFEKAPGAPVKAPEDFDQSMMTTWGKYVGKLQRLSLEYSPTPGVSLRPRWDKDTLFEVVLRGLDPKDQPAYHRFLDLMDWLKSLPQDKNSFGLVHCDLHYGNFFVHDGQITAFDFDDCCYHWFAYDMVTPLFHIWQARDQGKLKIPYQQIEESYLAGYLEEFALDEKWLRQKDLFTQFRISSVYHWVKACHIEGRFDGNPSALRWCDVLFEWAKEQFARELTFP